MYNVLSCLEKYKGNKIAIYGLGVETEKKLPELEKFFEIVGLLDSFKEDGNIYGKKIISFEKAITQNIKLIIVIARPGSCKAIAKKIGDVCRKNGIMLIDIRGNDLFVSNKVSYDFKHIEAIYKNELEKKISQANVVSFDLFETLVMRQTVNPTDVIGYVDCRLQEQGIYIKEFSKKRLQSEKELSRNRAPKLVEIYQDVLIKSKESGEIIEISAEKLAALEWEIDYDLIIARDVVCDIYKQAKQQGKVMYIISDSYYNEEKLKKILYKCGIEESLNIWSSSDYKTGKTQKLFDIFVKKESGKKILHIGDDIIADIECAEKRGISTYKIYSSMELFESVGYMGMDKYMDNLSDCLKIGMFISKIFNNPFQFENEDLRIKVSDVYDIGYLFCAPIISDFVHWFEAQVRKRNIKNIWFCARDGYLIQQLYRKLLEKTNEVDNSIYFLTSRTVAIRAGVEKDEDICYINEMHFSGTLKENLKKRFGIMIEQIPTEMILNDELGLLKYKKVIYNNAKELRNRYKEYITKCNMEDGEIAFFDFVAKGTSQLYVQRLVKNHLIGLYFLQLEGEYMEKWDIDVITFYKKEEIENSVIFENYYILETLLTSPYPSVFDFDDMGNPIYVEETRIEKDISCFMRAQEGIKNYFNTYLKLCPRKEWKENKKLDEILLRLIQQIVISDESFLDLIVEDSFFNRMTKITDIL